MTSVESFPPVLAPEPLVPGHVQEEGHLSAATTQKSESSGKAADHIKVVVRVRPFLEHEDPSQSSVAVPQPDRGALPSTLKVQRDRSIVFGKFDAVLGPESKQEDVYQQVRECVEAAISGTNVSIFAYGQTNAGKTYTMMGPPSYSYSSRAIHQKTVEEDFAEKNLPLRGVIPRFLTELLASTRRDDMDVKIEASFLQVYNERVLDLLAETGGKQQQQKALELRSGDRGVGEIQVVGNVKKSISSLSDVFDILQQGVKQRKVCETSHNEQSSRSHTILQLMLTVTSRGGGDLEQTSSSLSSRTSKISLVDLAGSERWSQSADRKEAVTKTHREEMSNINRSLTTLGRVVKLLSEGKHVGLPFRESKLTRLLQDSIGANCLTTIIAVLAPSPSSVDENISTLNFALRARKVRVQQNIEDATEQDARDREFQYVKEIRRLRNLLLRMQNEPTRVRRSGDKADNMEEELRAMQMLAEKQKVEIGRLRSALKLASKRGATEQETHELKILLMRERGANEKLKQGIRDFLQKQEEQEGGDHTSDKTFQPPPPPIPSEEQPSPDKDSSSLTSSASPPPPPSPPPPFSRPAPAPAPARHPVPAPDLHEAPPPPPPRAVSPPAPPAPPASRPSARNATSSSATFAPTRKQTYRTPYSEPQVLEGESSQTSASKVNKLVQRRAAALGLAAGPSVRLISNNPNLWYSSKDHRRRPISLPITPREIPSSARPTR
mmetsp:Transcript_5851/g.20658  ORF Transcript_5851/g.20658 Transcript_5851/m.20658 type:complete len:723 (-) Transcript_5851:1979-4147(-)